MISGNVIPFLDLSFLIHKMRMMMFVDDRVIRLVRLWSRVLLDLLAGLTNDST